MTATHPADHAQAHAISQTREAKLSLIGEINDGYERFCGAARKMSDAIIFQANEGRRIGSQLTALRATSSRDFGKLFTSDHGKRNEKPTFRFSAEWGRFFMRLTAAFPNEITDLATGVRSLEGLLRSAGELEESSRGEQQSHGALNCWSVLQKQLMSVQAIIGKEVEKAGKIDRAIAASIEPLLRPFAEQWREADAVLKGGG